MEALAQSSNSLERFLQILLVPEEKLISLSSGSKILVWKGYTILLSHRMVLSLLQFKYSCMIIGMIFLLGLIEPFLK